MLRRLVPWIPLLLLATTPTLSRADDATCLPPETGNPLGQDIVQYHHVEPDGRFIAESIPRSMLPVFCPTCFSVPEDDTRFFETPLALGDTLPRYCNDRTWNSETCRSAIQVVREQQSTPREIIPYGEAIHLFRLLLLDTSIPFEYSEDGCHLRNRMIRNFLESRGIDYQTAVIRRAEGSYLRATVSDRVAYWGFHIAPAIRVRLEDGRTQTLILDPSVLGAPGTLRSWARSTTGDRCRIFTSAEQAASSSDCSILLTRDRSVYGWAQAGDLRQDEVQRVRVPTQRRRLNADYVEVQRSIAERRRAQNPRLDPISGRPISGVPLPRSAAAPKTTNR